MRCFSYVLIYLLQQRRDQILLLKGHGRPHPVIGMTQWERWSNGILSVRETFSLFLG